MQMKLKQNSIKTKKIKYYNIFLFFSLCIVSCLISITQVFAEGEGGNSGGSNGNNGSGSSNNSSSSNNTVSSTSSANASVTVSSACSFNTTRATGYDSENGYTAILANNASTEITGSTFTTICNDPGGYAIYAVGYSNNTLGETDLISANGSSNITTSSSPASGASYWQMKLTATTLNQPSIDNGYSNYSAIPSTYTKVASYSSIADPASSGTRTGQPVTTYYKAYASSTQPADTYAGAVKYTMVHPMNITAPNICPANSICYSPNADGTVNGSMGNQTIASDATSATLLASNFWRSGYGFAGWNTEYDGSGTFYGPNEDIEFEAGQYSRTNGGLSLYAIWVKSTGYLQDWHGCQNLTQTTYNGETGKLIADFSSITALTDKRDNQTYAVARLADGNCWMIENLRLEAEHTRGDYYESLAQGYGGTPGVYGSFVGLANPETNFSVSATSNSVYKSDGSGSIYDPLIAPPTLEDIGTDDSPSYRMPRYRNTNTFSPATNPTTGNTNIYSYGNYYSWAATIADTTFYDTDSGSTNTSICPRGWRVPLSANNNTNLSFSKLDYQMGGSGKTQSGIFGTAQSKKWRSFPNNFLYSGEIWGGATGYGLYGNYWTSSPSTANINYSDRLYFGDSYIYPGTGARDKFAGLTIRCITE